LTRGLEEPQVARKRAEVGKNEHSPPPSHFFRRLLLYVFGGFGSLLIIAGILCCVAWKPLGEPDPQISNLALGIVLFVIAGLQAVFNAWQVYPALYLSNRRIGVPVVLSPQSLGCFRQKLLCYGTDNGMLSLPLKSFPEISFKFVQETKFPLIYVLSKFPATSNSTDQS
jgi:hypothetical protein